MYADPSFARIHSDVLCLKPLLRTSHRRPRAQGNGNAPIRTGVRYPLFRLIVGLRLVHEFGDLRIACGHQVLAAQR